MTGGASGITPNTGASASGHIKEEKKTPATQSNFASTVTGVSQTDAQSAAFDTAQMPHQDAANTLQGLKELYSEIQASGNFPGLAQYPVANMKTPGDVIAALNRTRTDASGRSREIAPAIKNHQKLADYCEIRTGKNGHEYIALKSNKGMADKMTNLHAAGATQVTKDAAREASNSARAKITQASSTAPQHNPVDENDPLQPVFNEQLQRVNAAVRAIPKPPVPATFKEKITTFFVKTFLPGFKSSNSLLQRQQAIGILQEYHREVDAAIDAIKKDAIRQYGTDGNELADKKIQEFKKQLLTQNNIVLMLGQAKDIFKPVPRINYILNKIKESASVDVGLLLVGAFTLGVPGIGVAVTVLGLVTIVIRTGMKSYFASKEYTQVAELDQEYNEIISNTRADKTDATPNS